MKCQDCKHFVKAGVQLNQGECRRFPPQVTAVGAPAGIGRMQVQISCNFPQVSSDRFCGEWQPVEHEE